MFSLSSQNKFHLYSEPTDMRKSFDGLPASAKMLFVRITKQKNPYLCYMLDKYKTQNSSKSFKDMLVEKPEDYLFSSARNYAELSSVLDIILETPDQIAIGLKTYG